MTSNERHRAAEGAARRRSGLHRAAGDRRVGQAIKARHVGRPSRPGTTWLRAELAVSGLTAASSAVQILATRTSRLRTIKAGNGHNHGPSRRYVRAIVTERALARGRRGCLHLREDDLEGLEFEASCASAAWPLAAGRRGLKRDRLYAPHTYLSLDV